MWANLLVNAADEEGEIVRPSFIVILKQMAPDEAKLLKHVEAYQRGEILFGTKCLPITDVNICLDGLQAEKVVERATITMHNNLLTNASLVTKRLSDYILTDRGRAFIKACEAPKAKSEEDVV